MKNRAGSFHFNGRYTLMNISGNWNIIDREKGGFVCKQLNDNTFTSAERSLLRYKAAHNDEEA